MFFAFSPASHGQFPAYPEAGTPEGVTYLDLGIGTYGLEIAASSQPVEDWGGALFLRWYPGPFGALYTIDSRYIGGAVLKYYGILSEGFFAGPLIAGEISSSFRPIAGAVWGYDFYTRFLDRSDFKNLHVGFEIQGGIDTEGEGFIGVGVKIGFGFRDDEELVDYN